jgi:hypothetical protein
VSFTSTTTTWIGGSNDAADVFIVDTNILRFILTPQYNFTYAACDYCPGEYWPDNKTGNHTLIIFATEQSIPDALVKLRKLVKDNVYV